MIIDDELNEDLDEDTSSIYIERRIPEELEGDINHLIDEYLEANGYEDYK